MKFMNIMVTFVQRRARPDLLLPQRWEGFFSPCGRSALRISKSLLLTYKTKKAGRCTRQRDPFWGWLWQAWKRETTFPRCCWTIRNHHIPHCEKHIPNFTTNIVLMVIVVWWKLSVQHRKWEDQAQGITDDAGHASSDIEGHHFDEGSQASGRQWKSLFLNC